MLVIALIMLAMNSKFLASVFVFSMGCASSAKSVAKPGSATPLVPALQQLGFYLGTWTCSGVQHAADGSIAEKMQLAIVVETAIENWLSVKVFQDGKALTSELKGWNPATKDYHHIWTANDGTFGSFTSSGWDGSKLVFNEDHALADMKTRMTFTKVDDAHFTHTAEVDRGKGFILDFEKSCSKQ
jgi:hypothetical protein